MEPITLGALHALLTSRPKDESVYFDFCNFVPTTLDSYRGFYDQLAFGFAKGPIPTVNQILDKVSAAHGAWFTGYKGGEFRMTADTPVWVANHGTCPSTGIVGIENVRWATIIKTSFCEWP